jgi:hypothetical protein
MPDAPASSAKLPSPHANRHAWALEKYGHLLTEALRKDTSTEAREVEKLPAQQIPAHLVSLILGKADPTQNKGMTDWLVRQYAEGNLRLEDLGTANDTLTMFRRYAQKLESGQRDLGQYSSLARVWDVVSPITEAEPDKLSGKAQKAVDKAKAHAESRILRQDEEGFTIAVPLTEFAAKWWGKGTRWCTAAEKNNQFGTYHKKAPLILVVIPELGIRGKFQVWVTATAVQFMDAADEPVSGFLVAKYWPRFEPIILYALQENGWALEYVPEDLITEEMCRIAVTQNGWALEYVPRALRTEEICHIAVAERAVALEYVPFARCTAEICKIAVTNDGLALEYVPEVLRTEQICSLAVAQHGSALKFVPEALRSEDMFRMSLSQRGSALGYMPKDLKTEGLCKIAVAQNGHALEYVPEVLRTEQLCSLAVAQHGSALNYVPWPLRTEDMCRIAVAQDGEALYHVPEGRLTEEMCRLAVAQNGRALKYIPWPLRTEDMCRIAVAQNGRALADVPEDLCKEDLCRIAVAQNGGALGHVPQKLRTEDICSLAVAQDGWALQYVPEAMRDRIGALIPLPIPIWDLSLLDELDSLLGSTSSPTPSGAPHA